MSRREIVVRVADLQVGGSGDLLVTIGLGSCIAIALHDSVACVGGLAHVLLPSPALTKQDGNPAKSPHTAVPRLLELMSALGASPRRVTARLAGGASMFAALAPPGHDPDGRAQRGRVPAGAARPRYPPGRRIGGG